MPDHLAQSVKQPENQSSTLTETSKYFLNLSPAIDLWETWGLSSRQRCIFTRMLWGLSRDPLRSGKPWVKTVYKRIPKRADFVYSPLFWIPVCMDPRVTPSGAMVMNGWEMTFLVSASWTFLSLPGFGLDAVLTWLCLSPSQPAAAPATSTSLPDCRTLALPDVLQFVLLDPVVLTSCHFPCWSLVAPLHSQKIKPGVFLCNLPFVSDSFAFSSKASRKPLIPVPFGNDLPTHSEQVLPFAAQPRIGFLL